MREATAAPAIRRLGKVSMCLSAAALAWTTATASAAPLIGDTIAAELDDSLLPGVQLDTTATVADPGVEFTFQSSAFRWTADFDADSLTLAETYTAGSGNGEFFTGTWTFSDLDFGGTPGGLLSVIPLVPNGATVSNVTTSGFVVDLPASGILGPGESVTHTFSLTTAVVPEPALLGLAGMGVALLGTRRWRTG